MPTFRLKANLPDLPQLNTEAARREFQKAVTQAAFEAERLIKTAMAEPKSGREYRFLRRTKSTRSGRRQAGDYIRYTASAPGEAPGVRPGIVGGGNLLNSVQVRRARGRISADTVVGAEYARHLEFGTNRMAARSFAAPAVKVVEPILNRRVNDLIVRLI